MIKTSLLLLLACGLSGCYRPWTVVREGSGSAVRGGHSLKVTLVDRFTAAGLVDKSVEKRREGRETRNHPYLSLLRIELVLAAVTEGLHLLRPADFSFALDGRPVTIPAPDALGREYRDTLYLTTAWRGLLRADITGGPHPARSVPFPPELTLLPGERVVFHVLVPRIPYRAREGVFSLLLCTVAGPGAGSVPLAARFPLTLRKIRP